MRPRVDSKAGRPRRALVGSNVDVRAGTTGARVGVQRIAQAAGAFLQHDRAPDGALRRRGLNPRLERHPGRQVKRRGVRDCDGRVGAVEQQGAAVLTGRRPRRVRDRPLVAVPGAVVDGGSRAFVEPVRRDETSRGGRRDAEADRAVGRIRVARGVDAPDVVGIRGAVGQAADGGRV